MALYYNNKTKPITQLIYNSQRIAKLYKGDTLMFQSPHNNWDLYTIALNKTKIKDKGKNSFTITNSGTTVQNSLNMLFNSSTMSISKNGVDLSCYNWKFESKIKFTTFDTWQTLIQRSGETDEYKFSVYPTSSGKITLKLQSGTINISNQFSYNINEYNKISFKRVNKDTFIFIVNDVSYSQTNSNITCYFNEENNTVIGNDLDGEAQYFRMLLNDEYESANKIFITSESKLDSSYSVVSTDVPAFHNIGMSGLGPFLLPVTIQASGLLDDVFFVFEGTDPEIYRQANPDVPTSSYYQTGVGTYDIGSIYWTQPKTPGSQPTVARQEVVNQNLTKYGAIPANKIFSIFLVDTVLGQAIFNGKITLKMDVSAGAIITQDTMKISFTDYPDYDYASVVKTKNNKVTQIIYTCKKEDTPEFSFTLLEGYVYEVRYYKNNEVTQTTPTDQVSNIDYPDLDDIDLQN